MVSRSVPRKCRVTEYCPDCMLDCSSDHWVVSHSYCLGVLTLSLILPIIDCFHDGLRVLLLTGWHSRFLIVSLFRVPSSSVRPPLFRHRRAPVQRSSASVSNLRGCRIQQSPLSPSSVYLSIRLFLRPAHSFTPFPRLAHSLGVRLWQRSAVPHPLTFTHVTSSLSYPHCTRFVCLIPALRSGTVGALAWA